MIKLADNSKVNTVQITRNSYTIPINLPMGLAIDSQVNALALNFCFFTNTCLKRTLKRKVFIQVCMRN